jgi:hypothetical protein
MYVKCVKKLRSQLSEKQIVFNSEKSGWKSLSEAGVNRFHPLG